LGQSRDLERNAIGLRGNYVRIAKARNLERKRPRIAIDIDVDRHRSSLLRGNLAIEQNFLPGRLQYVVGSRLRTGGQRVAEVGMNLHASGGQQRIAGSSDPYDDTLQLFVVASRRCA